MDIVTREQLRTNLRSLLVVKKPWQKRALEITQEVAMNQLIEEVLIRVLGSPENVLLAPSRVMRQQGERPGRWGQDEPHPVRLLVCTSMAEPTIIL